MKYDFTCTLGRAYTGVQKSLYKTADALGIDINIIRIPSPLVITYRISLNGNLSNIERFIEWFNNNYSKNYGEQEEEL